MTYSATAAAITLGTLLLQVYIVEIVSLQDMSARPSCFLRLMETAFTKQRVKRSHGSETMRKCTGRWL